MADDWYAVEGRYLDSTFDERRRPIGLAQTRSRAEALCQKLRWQYSDAEISCRPIDEHERVLFADEFLQTLEGNRGYVMKEVASAFAQASVMLFKAEDRKSQGETTAGQVDRGDADGDVVKGSDPLQIVTVEQMALLAGVAVGTVNNRLSQSRPSVDPIRPGGQNFNAYPWPQIRQWMLLYWPLRQFPEDFQELQDKLRELSEPR